METSGTKKSPKDHCCAAQLAAVGEKTCSNEEKLESSLGEKLQSTLGEKLQSTLGEKLEYQQEIFIKETQQLHKYSEKGAVTRSKRREFQDFYQLRDECIRQKILYEDPTFPATNSSLFFSKNRNEHYVWKRPGEIVYNPQFFVGGFSRFDVEQGQLGDCWLLAGIANLTLYRRLFIQVVPVDQGFRENYAGIFHFRFWQYGKWTDVVIDDRLPTHKGKLIYLHSSENNEFWSALLEKAYAKLSGSYECLRGGLTCEAMEDFTGGVTETYELESSPPNLFQILIKAYQRASLMGCFIRTDPRERSDIPTPEGLVKKHAYSITRVQYVETPYVTGKISLVRLRNPWGDSVEWRGAWSDGSPQWRYIPELEKQKLGLTFDRDGEFWMSFEDFKNNFNALEICNLHPDSLSDEELKYDQNKKWVLKLFDGAWVRGVTAGGCRNYLKYFCHNPQYRITLTEVDEDDVDGNCTMIVALMQKYRRLIKSIGLDLLSIGYVIYHIPNPHTAPIPLDFNFFKYNTYVARSDFAEVREISNRFKLPPGTYCIVPSAYKPNQEGEFLLRVFSENENVMEYGYNPNDSIRNIRGEEVDEEEEHSEPSAPSFPQPHSTCLSNPYPHNVGGYPQSTRAYPQSPGRYPQGPGGYPQSPKSYSHQPSYPSYTDSTGVGFYVA